MLTIERISSLVGRANATIIEVGANAGENTVQFAEHFPLGRVFAFEPDPRALERFNSRKLGGHVLVYNLAVGATSGRTTFFQSSGTPSDVPHERWAKGWDMSGSIRRPTGHLEAHTWCKFEDTIEVGITTLDDWSMVNKVDLVDFIWADVQGAEEDLIRGGKNLLSRTKYFYTEYCDQEMYEGDLNLQQISALLPNFEIMEIFETDVLFKNRDPISF